MSGDGAAEHCGHDGPGEPSEHRRYAAYRAALGQVGEGAELALVRRVLSDPDEVMARSAVLEHLDRRAAALLTEPGFEAWTETLVEVVGGDAFLARRVEEWRLLRAVVLGRSWGREAVLQASDWFQWRVVAVAAPPEVLRVLAEDGRTRRVRHAAGERLGGRGAAGGGRGPRRA
ncbi:hypothetical protein ABT026_17305 [Streptomyces sp. NPDC002734]|uniref:hypothetical protein n=1 Tax=Streptomyces sp. NPDC002734 TaxID=3154426 RepID=UPI00333450E2